MKEQELDIQEVSSFLEKFKEKFSSIEEQRFFCLGFLVGKGYTFKEAGKLIQLILENDTGVI